MPRQLAGAYAVASSAMAVAAIVVSSVVFGLFTGDEEAAADEVVAPQTVVAATVDAPAAYNAALADVESQRRAAPRGCVASVDE